MVKKFKLVHFIVSLIILFPLLFGTAPLPAPYHQYQVFGNIERQSGGPKENFVVSLIGKYSAFVPIRLSTSSLIQQMTKIKA